MHESETVEETTPFDPSEPSTIGSQPQNVRMHGRRLGKETGAGIIEHATAQGYDLRPSTYRWRCTVTAFRYLQGNPELAPHPQDCHALK